MKQVKVEPCIVARITKGNILIAKFMGWKVKQNGSWFNIYKPKSKNPTSYKAYASWGSEKAAWLAIANKTQYNKSWDWLMSVVEKIESFEETELQKGRVEINSHYCDINSMCEDQPDIIVGCFYESKEIKKADSKIEAVYKAVVKFIKWYNDRSK